MVRGLIAVVLLVLLVAACGSADLNATDATTIRELTGFDPGDENRASILEEHVATCMASAGFDYQPEPVPPEVSASLLALAKVDLDQVAETGYGITSTFRSGFSISNEQSANEAYLGSLGEAEGDTYLETLWGRVPQPGESFPLGGCRAEARHDLADASENLYFSLQGSLSTMIEQRLQATPEFVEAEEGWQFCMRQGGWEFGTRADAQLHVQMRIERLLTPQAMRPEVLRMDPQDQADARFEEMFTDATIASIVQIEAEEISIALSDATCAEPLIELLLNVAGDAERDLVADYTERTN